MALIKCPECGQTISDKSKICVHCGFPLEERKIDVDVSDDSEALITFTKRSCIGGIVLLGIMLEVVYPGIIVACCFMGSGGYIMAGIFGAIWLFFTIYAPFSIVKTIKTNVKTNSYVGKSVKYNRENNSFVFEVPDGCEIIPAKDVIQFDGPTLLKVTFFLSGKKISKTYGYIARKDAMKLRNKLTEYKTMNK